MIKSILIEAIKTKIVNLTGSVFQDFITELFLIEYEDQFVPIKQKRDKGNDGSSI